MTKIKLPKRRAILVAGLKGGVGKTFESLALMAAVRAQGYQEPVLIHLEAEDRCGRFFANRTDYHYLSVATEDLQKLERNPSLAFDVLDRVSGIVDDALSNGRHIVVDLPANFDHAISSYLREQGRRGPLGEGGEVLSVIVTHGRTDAMKAAGTSASLMRQALPEATVAVLFNNIDASASRGPTDPVYTDFVQKVRALGVVEVMHMEPLMAPVMLRAGDDLNIRLSELLVVDKETWKARGLDVFRAAREQSRAVEYVNQLREFLNRHA